MTRLWYRHWLELRRVLMIACAMTAVGALGYGIAVNSAATYFADTGWLTTEIARYEALRQMVPAPDLIPWAVHTLVAGFLALFASPLFQGTGLWTANMTGVVIRHPSTTYFTASLPVSRERIVGSRLAAAGACLTTVLALSLVLHILMLLLIGQPVPLIAMARTTLLAVLLGLVFIVVSAFLILAVSEQVAVLVVSGLTLSVFLNVAKDGWNRTLEFIAGLSVTTPAFVIAANALLIASALAIARRKEL